MVFYRDINLGISAGIFSGINHNFLKVTHFSMCDHPDDPVWRLVSQEIISWLSELSPEELGKVKISDLGEYEVDALNLPPSNFHWIEGGTEHCSRIFNPVYCKGCMVYPYTQRYGRVRS